MKKLLPCLLCLTLFCSCAPSRKISYFKDAELVSGTDAPVMRSIVLMPGDQLQFMVCVNNHPEITSLFYFSESGTNTDPRYNYFVIDSNGDLDLPVVGSVRAAGQTRAQIEQLVRRRITACGYGEDVAVAATHLNNHITIIGEVNRPGRFAVDRDNLTILEALSMGGDLTLNGRRDNITVVRNIEGVDNAFQMDIRSLDEVIKSPAFYLQNNDVVYVQPTDKRIREASVTANELQTTDFWLQLTSLEIRILKLLDSLNN
ncbi:MAG: polysaccharide biosynthesis/export family protein [Bacteroidaceae bacterium]|nr:polysaccharide biosynthesis/export family protein [Bacteroidaceae bacterium]